MALYLLLYALLLHATTRNIEKDGAVTREGLQGPNLVSRRKCCLKPILTAEERLLQCQQKHKAATINALRERRKILNAKSLYLIEIC